MKLEMLEVDLYASRVPYKQWCTYNAQQIYRHKQYILVKGDVIEVNPYTIQLYNSIEFNLQFNVFG